MEIKHLKLIETVSEEGSLTKAVDKLFLTQSALSHQLKEMETQLGTQIFHRVNKKLVLTGAGKIVLKSAKKILREIDDTKLEIKKYISGETGIIRLATECYTCYHWVPSLLQQFNFEFPKVDIRIHPEYTNDPLKALLNGKIDLAITCNPIDDPNIKYKELSIDEQVAVVPEGHSWTKKDYVTAEDFENQTLFIYDHPVESTSVYRNLIEPAGIKLKDVVAIQLTEATIEMVKAGLGIKVMATWALKPYLSSNRIATVRVTKNGLHRTWYVAMLNKEDTPSYFEYFVEHLCLNCSLE